MISKTFLQNSISAMKKMPDNSFDWAIVDPPYQIQSNSHRKNVTRSKKAIAKKYSCELWSQKVPSIQYFNELKRISVHQIIFGINYMLFRRKSLQVGPGRVIWDKCNGDSNYSDCEIAYCSSIDSVRLFPFMWHGMMQGQSMDNGRIQQANKSLNEIRIHPTQKPVELYKWIYRTFCKPGQSIIDTHLGSGSSRIAADMCGLDFYGYEIVPTYFKAQEKRWIEYKSQLVIPFK